MEPAVITYKPGTDLMPKPEHIEGDSTCPPGLEYLKQLDQLLVHQQIEIMEMVTGIDFRNRYQVKNTLGQQVYFALEQSTFCWRCCCGSHRKFEMTIADNTGREVIKMYRPWKCGSGMGSCWYADCCDCCSDEITIESPPGQVVAKIRHAGSKWYPHLEVKDASDNVVFDIWGPCCLCQAICCQADLNFKILSLRKTQQNKLKPYYAKLIFGTDGQTEVGNISKQWAGAVKECFTKVSNFGLQFPIDLDVKMKAALIGATMLIEYLYIEAQQDGNGGGGGS